MVGFFLNVGLFEEILQSPPKGQTKDSKENCSYETLLYSMHSEGLGKKQNTHQYALR